MGVKKGFALSLLMGLLLALIFVSMAILSASMQARDERDSQAFKFHALQSILSSSSDVNLRALGEIEGRNAIRNLDWHVRHSGIYSKNASKDLQDMILYGRCRLIDLNGDGVADLPPALVQRCAGNPAAPGLDCGQFDFNGDGNVDALDVACLTSPPSRTPNERDTLGFFASYMENFSFMRGFAFSLEILGFNASMDGPWSVSLNYTLNISVSDSQGTMGSSRISELKMSLPIDGFEDPLVGAESWKSSPGLRPPGAERQIFRFPQGREYRAVDLTSPAPSPDSRRGKGWVYANLTGIGDTSMEKRDNEHILVLQSAEGNYDIMNEYAGVIILDPPVVHRAERKIITQSSPTCTVVCEYYMREDYQNCLDCLKYAPYECDTVAEQGTDCPTVRPQEPTTLTGEHAINVPYVLGVGNLPAPLPVAALINSPVNNSVTSFNRQIGATDARVYNIEGLRALAVCGYYIESGRGPDFLERISGKLSADGSPNGIESLLVGTWANGTYMDEPLSRVDFEYYSNVTGSKIKGMPGCKNQMMCTRDGPLGNFALGIDSRNRYNANRIYCITEDC